MTIHTAVLVKNIKSLSGDLRWFSYNIFFTQYHTVASIKYDESAALFSWKGEILEE